VTPPRSARPLDLHRVDSHVHVEEEVMAFGWKLYGDGKTPPLGAAVAPDERLTWPRTIGIGAQHVVAMFGATFVFPLIMGLDPNLAIMMSGIATIIFLLIVNGRIPSYLGTSASFVGGVFAIRAQGGDSSDVVGAILISGVVLALVGMVIHFLGARVVNTVLPPAVTGAVVMLIGFNLAPVVATTYWPQDQWVALATMAFVIICSLLLRGFWARISILLGLVFGYLLSFLLDATSGQITSALPGANLLDASGNSCAAAGPYCVATAFPHDRISFSTVGKADWFGLPNFTAPTFSVNFSLLVLPAVIALIAENAGHVKAVSAMTKRDLDPLLGRAIAADGVATVVATSVGGSPTTTYAENIGVMAATRVYSTAAYYVAAIVAILLGLCPKFGALVNIIPGGVLGGITVVLYGMIGLLGAKIWKENRVDFANPINLVPLAAGIIIAIGDVSLQITDTFSLSGIAFGSIVAVAGWHLARVVAPAEMKEALLREGTELGTAPVLGGSEVAEARTEVIPDPSTVDEVGRPGVDTSKR
jgi:uracil-xanthine permease